MKQAIVFGALLITMLFGFSTSTHAAATAYNSYCVDFTLCSTGTDNTSCQPVGNDTMHTSSFWGHRVQFPLATNYAANQTIYIVECIHNSGADINGDGTADKVCTTGNSTLDKTLFCADENATSPNCDRLTVLKNAMTYDLDRNLDSGGGYGVYHLEGTSYVRKSPPTTLSTGATGNPGVAKIEWQSHTPPSQTAERSYVIFESLPNVTPIPSPTGAIGGQQQGTVGFPPPGNINAANCKIEAWDPYGMVFDTVSLEPITGAAITIEQKKPDGTFDANYALQMNRLLSSPPFITGVGGRFSFFVVNGDYHMRLGTTGYTHATQADVSSFDTLTRQMYSDFYLSDSPAILERGTLVHVDIPLKPSDGVGKSYPLHIFSENFVPKDKGKLAYSGEVSHPLSTLVIEICSDETGTKICKPHVTFDQAQGGPNRKGEFAVTLDQTVLNPGQYFERSFLPRSRQQAAQSKSFIKQIISMIVGEVHAQDAAPGAAQPIAKIQPLYTYLEGHAYDLEGNLLPNATIQLFISLFEVPIYTTQANDQGYFRITSDNIPKELYTIRYVTQEGVEVPVTTSQYALQNQEFVAAEEVNLYSTAIGKADPRNNITPAFQPQQKISPVPGIPEPTQVISPIPETSKPPAANNPLLLVGAIALLLIGGAGALIGLHMYRKRSVTE